MLVLHDKRMAEAKIIAWLFYVVGVPVYTWAILLNIETWKSNLLFGLAIIMILMKGYFEYQKNNREDRKARQEEAMRQIEIEERKTRK